MNTQNCNTNKNAGSKNTTANPFIDMLMDIFSNGMNMVQEDSKGNQKMVRTPRMNAYTTDNTIVGEFLMPGVDSKDDIKITYNDKFLTVSYDAPVKDENTDNPKYIMKEFNTSRSYSRKVRIQPSMDLEKMSAKYDNGILKLTIPVKEEAKIETKEVSVS